MSAHIAHADRGHELGTSYDVVVVAPPEAAARIVTNLEETRALCHAYDAMLSEWRDDSELSALNRTAFARPVALSEPLAQILLGAAHVARVTHGAFDVTWAPLGAMWRRAAACNALPDAAERARVLAAVGPDHLRLTRGPTTTARLGHADSALGIAGVAKGWIIDALFHALHARHADVTVNIGGDLRTSGRAPGGQRHTLAIADPFYAPFGAHVPGHATRPIVATLDVENVAVATSGNYLRFHDVNGVHIGHNLDPRTGEPPAFDGSVTVLTRDAAMADALATALFVMGPELGLAFAEQLPGLEALYVTRHGVRMTRGLRGYQAR